MAAIVVIGISSDLPSVDYARKIDSLMGGLDEYEIVAVNDKNKVLEAFAKTRSKKITFASGTTRLGFRQVIAKCTHLIVFWSGHDLSELIFFASLRKIPIRIIPFAVTTVVNRDHNQPFDVYIGRGTPWGNPFPIDHASDVGRMEVIDRYKKYFEEEILGNPEKKRALESLRGLRLACHCKPKPCHGDIIAEYLNATSSFGDE